MFLKGPIILPVTTVRQVARERPTNLLQSTTPSLRSPRDQSKMCIIAIKKGKSKNFDKSQNYDPILKVTFNVKMLKKEKKILMKNGKEKKCSVKKKV